MKKFLALILTAAMLLTLAACSGNGNLQTFEMTVEPYGAAEPAKATVGYPSSFTMEEKDWCVTLTNEKKDVAIEAYFINDYDCYDVNQEYAEEEYFFYEEGKFGDYDGYACMVDEYSSQVEVYVYLDCVAEMDDVYVCFYVSSASRDLDADVQALYKMKDVRQVLDSVVYTAPAVIEE